MRIFVLSLFLFSSLLALNIEDIKVSSFQVANGKTVLLRFIKEKNIHYENVMMQKKKFQIFDAPDDASVAYVLLPFSYYEKRGNKTLQIIYTEDGKKKSESMLIKVVDGKYEKEEIHVSASKVNPQSKEVKARISKEYNQAMKIYHTVTPKSYIHRPFIQPLNSKITSAFGKARIYNGSLKGYHSGTDFRAPMGTPVVAANDARVALVEKRFYSGGTVLLDHGEGIYTCYFHMSKFSVKAGDFVKRGEILGLSGKSGRVTGPHLHFSARINGVQVDPLQLINLLNKNLLKEQKIL